MLCCPTQFIAAGLDILEDAGFPREMPFQRLGHAQSLLIAPIRATLWFQGARLCHLRTYRGDWEA